MTTFSDFSSLLRQAMFEAIFPMLSNKFNTHQLSLYYPFIVAFHRFRLVEAWQSRGADAYFWGSVGGVPSLVPSFLILSGGELYYIMSYDRAEFAL